MREILQKANLILMFRNLINGFRKINGDYSK